jgi:ubiquitin-conjugating enzyme E2 D/E
MAQAKKRIQKELEKFNIEESEGFTAGPIDDSDLFKWQATVAGPEDSPYEGGIFELSIEFPQDFPYKPPRLCILTKIFHPNLNYYSGTICCCALDFLKNSWNPCISVLEMLIAFQNLLINPNIEKVCGLGNYEAANLYKEDKNAYEIKAKEWTEKYAKD